MSYKINFEAYSNNFALPQEIIDEGFESLDPVFLKVILIIYRNSDKNYSINLISNLLGISESKVNSAIDYWIKRNLLNQTAGLTEDAVKQKAIILKNQMPTANTISGTTASRELAFLLECMENILGRPVTSTEQKSVVHIMEFLKLPADVILMAIEYCISIDKINARYIEKVCTTWTDNGIVTHELAEQYLNLLKTSKGNEAKVQKIFGIEGRTLIDAEREHINRWLNEYRFSLDMVKIAYEKTIQSIGKVSFPYINKILASWYEKGFQSVDDVQRGAALSKAANAEKKSTTSYDLDMLDKFWDNVPKLD